MTGDRRSALAVSRLAAVMFAGLLSTLVAFMSLGRFDLSDFDYEAKPAVDALQQGDVHAFIARLPGYGGSLILRAPAAILPDLWNGGATATFRMMAAPGLIAMALLGLVLWRQMVGERRILAGWVALCLCAAAPISVSALEIGHAEELLGTALVAGAAIAAGRGSWRWCALLLGLAIFNKAWALLAVVPIVWCLPSHRWRTAGMALVLGCSSLVIMRLGTGAGGASLAASARDAGTTFKPWQVFWFFGPHGHLVISDKGAVMRDYRLGPRWAAHLSHPLVVLAPLALAGLLRVREMRGGPAITRSRALRLLAASLLLRCLLDTWDISYYVLPFCVCLLVWELDSFARTPWFSVAAAAIAWAVMVWAPRHVPPDAQSALFLACALPTAVWLVSGLLGLRVRAPQPAIPAAGGEVDAAVAAAI